MTTPDHARFVWADFGWWVHPTGVRKLLSWNAATKELAFWPLHHEPATVIAVIDDEDELRRRLEGWAEHNDSKEGLAWLANRLEGCR